MKYFLIALCLVAIVIVSVWQNVEVVKIKIEHKKKIALEKKIIKQRDRLIYEIEKRRSIGVVEKYARHNNSIKPLQPNDVDVLQIEENKK